ncbi:alpha/beta hydrolase, partial [Actinomadura adrarensis]
ADRPGHPELRSRSLSITVGARSASGDGVPALSARTPAGRLGFTSITFPGDHRGLMTYAVACADIVHTVLS